MRQQDRPRSVQYRVDGSYVSPGMIDLIQMHGSTLTIFPLISYVDLLGLILIGDAELDGLSDTRWQLIEMASNQVASQVLNTRVHALTHQALDERLEQLNILAVVAQQISAALDPDTILATMLEMAVKSTSANVGTVALLQEGEETWKIIQYSDTGVLQRSQRTRQGDEGVIGQVARTRDTLLIRDTREMPNTLTTPNTNVFLSSVAVPLISEGKVIGVLHMESLRPDFFSKEQISFLNNLGRHAVISIENARLLEERQHQIMSLRHLQGLSLRLSSVTETGYVALEVVRTALDLLHGRKGALFRIAQEDEGRRMDLLAEVGEEGDGIKPSQLFRNSTVASRAAQTGEVQILQEIRQINDGAQERFYAISVPIKRGDRVREILCIGFERQRTFSKRELDSITCELHGADISQDAMEALNALSDAATHGPAPALLGSRWIAQRARGCPGRHDYGYSRGEKCHGTVRGHGGRPDRGRGRRRVGRAPRARAAAHRSRAGAENAEVAARGHALLGRGREHACRAVLGAVRSRVGRVEAAARDEARARARGRGRSRARHPDARVPRRGRDGAVHRDRLAERPAPLTGVMIACPAVIAVSQGRAVMA